MADENLPCTRVNLLLTTQSQCDFLSDNHCLEERALVDYMALIYCRFGLEMRAAAITMIVLLLLILFATLSAIADEFLCQNLLTLAKTLRMSDSLAVCILPKLPCTARVNTDKLPSQGITLLAFGNGCPDILTSWIAADDDRFELVVGELLGGGIFCTSLVIGLIFVRTDFKLARRPILRDTSFYALAVFLTWLYCYSQQVTFIGALAFIAIYILYIIVALVSQAVHARKCKVLNLECADDS